MPVAVRSDRRGPRVATAAPPATWNDFVDRFGVTAAVGLIAAIDVNCMIQNAGIVPPDPVTAVQLLLVMVMLGCIAVLSFRTPARRPRSR